MRLIVFVNPEIDPMGYGYQLLQSMIAIGAGGPSGYFFRSGELFQGTQTGLNFLPEQHTDFIFSVLGEEFGFLGSVIMLLLFFFLIYRIIRIAIAAKDTYGSLVCVGVASLIMFQVLVNIGMTISIMPVTGCPCLL
jgi:rod shape determining protein RodA